MVGADASLLAAHADLRLLVGRASMIVLRLDADGWLEYIGEGRVSMENARTSAEYRAAEVYTVPYCHDLRKLATACGHPVRELHRYSLVEVRKLAASACDVLDQYYKGDRYMMRYRDEHPRSFAGTWRDAYRRVRGREAPR